MQRNEQLIKEMENQRHHGGYAQMQLDGLKRELADALVSFLYQFVLVLACPHYDAHSS